MESAAEVLEVDCGASELRDVSTCSSLSTDDAEAEEEEEGEEGKRVLPMMPLPLPCALRF